MNPLFPHLEKALDITGQFEGRGFDQVTGDFDGQGISVGVLQWNYGQGSLQSKILKPFQQKHGLIDTLQIFPKPGVDSTAGMTTAQALHYCRAYMLTGTKLRAVWADAWKRFMSHRYMIDIQIKAAEDVALRAQGYCNDWKMPTSQQAFCFFFDIVTQNGSMKSVTPRSASLDRDACRSHARQCPNNVRHWLPLIDTASHEQLLLFQAAYHRSRLANPTYFQDTFSRKGTIALGRGFVHGKIWNLSFPADAQTASVPSSPEGQDKPPMPS